MEYEFRLQLLFNKYLQRQCTQKEIEELIVLLQQGDADEILSEQMQALWEQFQEDNTQYSMDWDKMYNFISNADAKLSLHTGRKNSIPKFWYGAAATIILLFSGMAIYLYSTKQTGNNTKPAAVSAIKHEQPYNQRQTIHLPDSSTVILNTNSKLDYPSAFNSNKREVYLTGEAFFNIMHKPEQPFFVHAGNITTKVMGTEFDIKAYPADNIVQVTVIRGKVQVLNKNKSLGMIITNQQISCDKETEEYVQKEIDTKSVVAWKPAEIFFNDITMEEAAKQIEQRFNMQIYFINPAVKNCRITATFSEDDLPDEILTVICGVSSATYNIQNNKITINGEGCN